MEVTVGSEALDFEVLDIFGDSLALHHYKGEYILLSFYRYANCPLSNLRIHELMSNYNLFSLYGIQMIGIFMSPSESIIETVLKQNVTFPLVGDADQKLYRLYGVEPSVGGFFKGVAKRQAQFYEAMIQNKFLLGKVEGDYKMLPADFLIDRKFNIVKAYYGEDIGDFMPLELVLEGLKLIKNKKDPQE